MTREQRHVYFACRDGLIKIGSSNDPPSRVHGLRAHFLAAFPGDFETERFIHHFFFRERIKGEWFLPSRALLNFIAAVPPIEFKSTRAPRWWNEYPTKDRSEYPVKSTAAEMVPV